MQTRRQAEINKKQAITKVRQQHKKHKATRKHLQKLNWEETLGALQLRNTEEK